MRVGDMKNLRYLAFYVYILSLIWELSSDPWEKISNNSEMIREAEFVMGMVDPSHRPTRSPISQGSIAV
jgi:hypothetical protein